MKNLNIPIDHLVMLAELDDKDAGLMAKAIAQYANKGIAPSFSNSALKAIFTLFRSIIDAQRESSAKRSEINTTMQSKRYIRNSVLIATNRSPFGNPSTKRRSVKPSISFKPTSVKRLTPLTRCI